MTTIAKRTGKRQRERNRPDFCYSDKRNREDETEYDGQYHQDIVFAELQENLRLETTIEDTEDFDRWINDLEDAVSREL